VHIYRIRVARENSCKNIVGRHFVKFIFVQSDMMMSMCLMGSRWWALTDLVHCILEKQAELHELKND
jgi:hypothetical protein